MWLIESRLELAVLQCCDVCAFIIMDACAVAHSVNEALEGGCSSWQEARGSWGTSAGGTAPLSNTRTGDQHLAHTHRHQPDRRRHSNRAGHVTRNLNWIELNWRTTKKKKKNVGRENKLALISLNNFDLVQLYFSGSATRPGVGIRSMWKH